MLFSPWHMLGFRGGVFVVDWRWWKLLYVPIHLAFWNDLSLNLSKLCMRCTCSDVLCYCWKWRNMIHAADKGNDWLMCMMQWMTCGMPCVWLMYETWCIRGDGDVEFCLIVTHHLHLVYNVISRCMMLNNTTHDRLCFSYAWLSSLCWSGIVQNGYMYRLGIGIQYWCITIHRH